jgi:hypothetical protein
LVSPPTRPDTDAVLTITRRRRRLRGQHPEQILLDLGYDWPAIAALKHSGTVL